MRAHSPIMLTQRSRYALRAMLYLAQTPAGGPPIAMHRIASHANVPRKFLELILADLRDAGLLVSRRGKLGGYHLSKPTHLVSLGEILRIIEGDRKSVGEGKSVSVRVDLGGRRIIKKKQRRRNK